MIVDMPSFERRPVFTTKGIASARRHLTDASLQAASRIEAFVEEPPLARHFTLDLGDNYVVTIYERLAPTTTNQQSQDGRTGLRHALPRTLCSTFYSTV